MFEVWVLLFIIVTIVIAKVVAEKMMDPMQIVKTVNEIKKDLRKQGLHRWTKEKYEKQFVISNPLFFNCQLSLENVLFAGLADFEINKLDVSLIPQRARFDVSIPKLTFGFGSASVESTIFLKSFKGIVSGQIILMQIRLCGEVDMNIDEDSKSVNNIQIKFSLQAVKSNLKVSIVDVDYSETLNNFLQNTLPEFLKTHEGSINKFLEMLSLKIMNEVLQDEAVH